MLGLVPRIIPSGMAWVPNGPVVHKEPVFAWKATCGPELGVGVGGSGDVGAGASQELDPSFTTPWAVSPMTMWEVTVVSTSTALAAAVDDVVVRGATVALTVNVRPPKAGVVRVSSFGPLGSSGRPPRVAFVGGVTVTVGVPSFGQLTCEPASSRESSPTGVWSLTPWTLALAPDPVAVLV